MIFVQTDLTRGSITGRLLKFALPMMAGNLLQQVYNIADTLIVGRFLGSDALAAVGSSYTLMVFLTSVLLGLSMGAGAYFSIQFGRRDTERLRQSAALSFAVIALVTLVMNALMFAGINGILRFLKVPSEVTGLMKSYLLVIFSGLIATFLYNFFACLLRALGNSAAPLWFLAVSALLNVGLDLLFVLVFRWGVAGAAGATVLAQYVSGVGIAVYFWRTCPELRPRRQDYRWDGGVMREIGGLSLLTCFQQSIMNFGILMVQGLVNSFGAATMAAFAAAVKIDSFAYSPVQDFGNAFSTFVAQNHGAAVRPGADADLRLGGGGGDHRHRRGLPAHRGGLLFRHRPAVPVLRLLPGRAEAGDVGGADHPFAGHPGGAGLCAVRSARRGRHRHLAQCPHRLGAGRSGRCAVLF